jgi:hypothetical protein
VAMGIEGYGIDEEFVGILDKKAFIERVGMKGESSEGMGWSGMIMKAGEMLEGRSEGRTHNWGEPEELLSLRHDVIYLERNYMNLVSDYRAVLLKNED